MTIIKNNDYLIFNKYLKKNKVKLFRTHKEKFFSIYSETLKSLKILLNKYHNIKFNTKDWEIIIGPWLFLTLNIFFFYSSLNLKKQNLSGKKKVKDVNLSDVVPIDFDDYYNLISRNEFFIKHFFTHENTKLNLKYKKIVKIKKNSFLKNFLNLTTKKICRENSIIFNNLKINKLSMVKLILFNLFKFQPFYSKNSLECLTKIKKTIDRKEFFSDFSKINSSEKNFTFFLEQTMPSSYLENFSVIKDYAILNFPRSNFFLTESSYINDDFFKINCSLSKKRNLVIMQHGGNLRFYDKNLHDLVENRISSKILVWGKIKRSKKEIFFPSTRLIKFKNTIPKYDEKKNRFKYCVIFEPFRKFKIQFFKINFPLENLLEITKFFKKIKEKNFLVKLHYEKEQSNFISKNEILKICNIKQSHIAKDLDKVLKSELIIFNYLSTMMFEILQINKPFIVIIKNEDHFFSKLGHSLVKDLKKNKLLFNNIEQFYSFSRKIDIHTWWHSKKNQKFLNELKKNYSLIDDNFSFNAIINKI